MRTRLENKRAPWTLKGQGVFETMRAKRDKVFFIEEHLNRLYRGLSILKIKAPYSRIEMKRHLTHLLRAKKFSQARIRLSVWRDKNIARTAIGVWKYKPYSLSKYQRGFKACLIPFPKTPPPNRAALKSIDYLPFIKAYRRARKHRCDEAILVNKKGYISEGSRTNVFMVRGRTLFAPSLKAGGLNGITRKEIIKLAKQKKIPFKTKNIIPQNLREADEVFVTNALLGIMPVTRMDKHKINKLKIGPVTSLLTKYYFRLP